MSETQANGNYIHMYFRSGSAEPGGTPSTDLFASRSTNQVPLYFSWKLDPYSQGQDALQLQVPKCKFSQEIKF